MRKAGGWHEGRHECPTCGQFHAGAMQLGLARTLVELYTRKLRPGARARLCAEDNLGRALRAAGQLGEAAEVLTRLRRAGG